MRGRDIAAGEKRLAARSSARGGEGQRRDCCGRRPARRRRERRPHTAARASARSPQPEFQGAEIVQRPAGAGIELTAPSETPPARLGPSQRVEHRAERVVRACRPRVEVDRPIARSQAPCPANPSRARSAPSPRARRQRGSRCKRPLGTACAAVENAEAAVFRATRRWLSARRQRRVASAALPPAAGRIASIVTAGCSNGARRPSGSASRGAAAQQERHRVAATGTHRRTHAWRTSGLVVGPQPRAATHQIQRRAIPPPVRYRTYAECIWTSVSF